MSRIDVHLRSGPQMLQYEAIARRIAREQHGPVLDWGTGFGQVAKLLADEGVDVTPFEYRADLPEGVRPLERYPELQAYSSPDPVRLPFDDASFDAVLSCGVLEHVHDPDGSLEELRRVLRPGGRFAVSDVIAGDSMDDATRADMQQWTGCIAGALTRAEFEAGLVAAGFVDVEIQETHRVHDHAVSAIVRATKPA